MILGKLLSLPGIILGLSFHEFAHAWVSDRLGDPTPRRDGRVTINPLAHIDWIGFAALLLVGFGWGKPVVIDPRYYKNRRRDEFLVAIAGVTMNLILAVIISIPVRFMMKHYATSMPSDLMYNIFQILYYAVTINVVLMVFNLLPVPPLDGWNIVTQLFKLDQYDWWYKVYQYGTYILLALIVFNVTDLVLTPLVNMVMKLLI
ncbi:MAG: site-2 protease family protein [Mogibacterium sp.]|nr:site-2 protease family protein [Mogibacterium sp.]